MENNNRNDYYYDKTENTKENENGENQYRGDYNSGEYSREKYNNNNPYSNGNPYSNMNGYGAPRMTYMPKKRGWSVAALVLSIVSIVCCCLPVVSIVLGALSILFAIISRINLGYFDGLSVAGLVVGIFGLVMGIFTMIGLSSIDWDAFYEEFMREYEKALEENMNNGI